ncbi:TRAP transporter large permease [Tuberibacillus sp. Marseille-P3662]|uniref:TRAP transporter large permease n=1 Tax=Tuberibacillus sp. Marseille-P3662 TaxID=1965358 RepID=UPI000A1CA428|nr:TRAP transporter large permease [Tuberibacillus sp. Marseille-P3662]
MSIFLIMLFFVLMFFGIPIAVSLGIASVFTIVLFTDVPISLIIQSMYSSMNSFIMVAVPLFILAGMLMDEGGIAERIFDFAKNVVGWITGGLGHVNILANLIFAGMAGSSVAEVASIGKLSINAMTRNHYPLRYATGITLAASMLATIIPPSILMVIAASVAGVSVGKALIGGLIPGLIVAIAFMIFNYFYSKKHQYGKHIPFDFKQLISSFVKALPALLAPVVLLGGILSGYFTPTEAAAIAVLYTLVVSLFIYKIMSFKQLPDVFFRTAKLSGTILFIAVTAKPASWIFEYDGLPIRIATFISDVSNNPFVIMAMLFVFLIVVGMFMDATAAIFILVPILMPTINAVGIDPIFFVIYMVILLSFGLITPPIGVCLYAAGNITGLSIETITKSTLPWILLTFVILFTFIVFPSLITVPLTWFGL